MHFTGGGGNKIKAKKEKPWVRISSFLFLPLALAFSSPTFLRRDTPENLKQDLKNCNHNFQWPLIHSGMSDLQRYPLNFCYIKDLVDIIYIARNKCQITARVYTSTNSTVYTVTSRLPATRTQYSAIRIRVFTSSLAGQLYKEYRCKSEFGHSSL